jgi:3-hydroxyacyl-CoA dehydrogenase
LRDSFHYCAVHLNTVADTAREIDFAMRWGFGSSQGPFELWQAAGWTQVAQWIAADIAEGKTLSSAPLPAWVTEGPVAAAGGDAVAAGDRPRRGRAPFLVRRAGGAVPDHAGAVPELRCAH